VVLYELCAYAARGKQPEDHPMDVKHIAERAGAAAVHLAGLESSVKDRALTVLAHLLEENAERIFAANRIDTRKAEREHLAAPLLKRLTFDRAKLTEAVDGVKSLAQLADPVGVTLSGMELDHGLELYKVSCPIGVIGVIFESRPDALIQISSLCLKSGNAVLLKGGSEAAETNRVLSEFVVTAGNRAGLPEGWVALVETRADVGAMLQLDGIIDLIIPRGSNAFVKHIMENTRIPVLGHADGICHVYVDQPADLQMAARVVVDSKCQYVAVCNAVETLLVHRETAADFLPLIKGELEKNGVEIRGCPKTLELIDVKPATESDWRTEYLDLVLSLKVVDSLEAAVDHINRYGSGHTDVIVTADRSRGIRFMDLVDSADVFVNCSSRFSDGYRYGLGAEVGISTNKIHARGPVGLEGLLIYKWRMIGNGHIVSGYSGRNARTFTHRRLDRPFPR
jgi:glutamate-5-semialdehyde dehydrogenase